ncbi:MAG TPA: helix-turn-helix domain-containing protein [Candidatus Udaeobacter sp.]|nr:helix-turn-helix domain-containing protein [Candidatus Udaeobacter sp.]
MQTCYRSTNKPERIASVNVAAKRLGVSRATVEKYIRRGLIAPDFKSDLGTYFRPERLSEIRSVIRSNRAAKRAHCGTISPNSI